MIRSDELIEYARYVENYYGTPKAYVEQQMEAGKDVILEIEIQGALKVKEQFPNALLLFVMPPSAAQLKERLIGRGTETPEVIESRLKRAAEESEGIEHYDYILVNDQVEDCVKRMHQLIQDQAGSVFSVAFESYPWVYVGAILPSCQAHSGQSCGNPPCLFSLCAGCYFRSP